MDTSIDELLLSEMLLENREFLLDIETIKTFCSDNLLS
jgi:hypothetical protein